MHRIFLPFLLTLATLTARSATIVVYAFNTEFSLNQPGQPIERYFTIAVGDVVQWQWLQGNHTTTTVTTSPEQWNAVLTSSSQTFSRQFNTPGVYWYYCNPHGADIGDGTAGGMHGRITVLAGGGGACCLPNGSCTVTDAAGCTAAGGTFQGVGTSCTPNPCSTGPTTLTLQALKDNSIYSENGAVSNGGGASLFVGVRQSNTRRSLLSFDLSAIPSGASITAAEVRLTCTTLNTAQSVSLHELGADWGEGTATGTLNAGAVAAAGDATWTHRNYNTTAWTTAGGQFSATASATTTVSATGQVIWNSAAMLADVQMWQAMPGMNWGWIIRANEVTNNVNVTFASSENATAANRPVLVVTYTPPGLTGACCMTNGSCSVTGQSTCASMGGTYQGDGTDCSSVYCSVSLTPYLDPLPLPGVAQPVTGQPGGTAHYDIAMTEQFQQLHSQLPLTRTWGYAGSYPGPTIEARRGLPVTVQWRNDLRVGGAGGPLRTAHVLDVDTCLHGPNIFGTVPVGVVHLHGGKVATESDGYPEHYFAPGQSAPNLYVYPNKQQAATIWYHDHALGITRLNVMMGMAGFYLIRDEVEDALALPAGEYEIPMAIQDRQFNADGSFRYEMMSGDEFYGDKILVNGKVWPYLNVKRGKYRFRLLNGSNSRAYTLALSNGAGFHQIGSDGGLLPAPVPRTSVTLLPGERADVVIDFAPYAAGTQIIFTNSAPAPFPGFIGVGVVPNVMKFIVQAPQGYTLPLPSALAIVPEIPAAEASTERVLELMTMPMTCNGHTHLMWTIDGRMWDEITEQPIQGATEIWTFKNPSGISHPMHLHLEFGQLLNRQAIDDVTGQPTGPLLPPAPNEVGWKDTWDCPPGYFTRVRMRFDASTGLYPYHCHILEHEDHEMMRQFLVTNPVRVAITALLDGPYDPAIGLMHDSLRVRGLVPLKEPYSDMDFGMHGGTGQMITGTQLGVSGASAIVDWVLVELRSASSPYTVLRTRTALILRSGHVVATDGTPYVSFDMAPGLYRLALRHRNHLGVMTGAAIALDATVTTTDMSNPTTTMFGTDARRLVNGGTKATLWSGNVQRDDRLKYVGENNDRDPILVRIGGNVPTNVVLGYYSEDVNLDGRAKYVGQDNDRDPILLTIGGNVPTAVKLEQLP